jgi:hypothetical protein
VRNCSHDDPLEHEYLVRIVDGIPSSCDCPADEHFDGACKHRVAVAIRRPVLGAALEHSVATDGGVVLDKATEAEEDDPPACDCSKLHDGVPCWPCFRDGEQEFDREVEESNIDD